MSSTVTAVQHRQLEISTVLTWTCLIKACMPKTWKVLLSGNFFFRNQPRGEPEVNSYKGILKAVVEVDISQTICETAKRFNYYCNSTRPLKLIPTDDFRINWLNTGREAVSKLIFLCCYDIRTNNFPMTILCMIKKDSLWQAQRSAQWLDKDQAPKKGPKPNIRQRIFGGPALLWQ